MRIDRRLELDDETIDRVWAAWTESGHLGRWLTDAGADIDLEPGGAVTLTWSDGSTRTGVVDVAEAPHRLVFRLAGKQDEDPAPGDETSVALTLTQHEQQLWLTLLVTGYEGFEDPQDTLKLGEAAWDEALRSLQAYLKLW